MSDQTPAELLHAANQVDQSGNELLRAGLAVGAVGLGGALIGAVCPLCVVVTPALLGLGAVQKLRAVLNSRRAKSAM